MLDDATIAAYLDRIGVDRPAHADLDTLRVIQRAHLYSVPFENLSYHLGEEIYMDERVVDKIVLQRRGGGCYEVNPGLSFLLQSLGYEVALLPGRVWIRGRLTAPLYHLAVKVRVAGHRWLMDVGFGRNSCHPLSLETEAEQPDPHGRFRVRRADDGGVDVLLGELPQYRLYDVPCGISDFGPTLWWYRTAPDSPFLQNLFCSMPIEGGRVTLKEDQLTIVEGDRRETVVLAGENEILAAYDKWFGIQLAEPPVRSGSRETTVSMSFD